MTRRELRKAKTQAEADEDLLLAARLLELWRLCGNPRRCCEALAEWSEMLATKDKTSSFEQCMDELRAKQ